MANTKKTIHTIGAIYIAISVTAAIIQKILTFGTNSDDMIANGILITILSFIGYICVNEIIRHQSTKWLIGGLVFLSPLPFYFFGLI